MRSKGSRTYCFWDTLEVVVEGVTDGEDPLASRFGRFQVGRAASPDLEILKTPRLTLQDPILLPEERGFITAEGLGWSAGADRGIFLTWPRDLLEEWRLKLALNKVKFPYFRHFLDLKAIGKKAVAIHGSAVVWKGKSVVAAGPPAVGKTSLIAGLIKSGGELVGDDWLWLRSQGSTVSVMAMEETIELSPEKVDLLISRRKLSWRLRKEYWAARIFKTLALLFAALIRSISPFLALKGERFAGRRKILLPVEYFRSQKWLPSKIKSTPVSHCFLILQGNSERVSIQPLEASEMARRLTMLNRISRSWIYEVCHYAELSFSESRLKLSEFERMERGLFEGLLKDVDCFLISYPERIDPDQLHQVVVRHI